MLRKNAWFALALLVAFMPTTLLAQEMMHGKWWNDRAVAEEMKLTDSERKNLDQQYTDSRRRMVDLKSKVEKERLELDIALDKEGADKKQINERYEKLEKARSELSKERFRLLTEVRDIVGVERFQTLKSMHRNKKRDRMDRGFKDKSHWRKD
jgi:Spy/CpxP family protein refolding chaperone